MFYPLESLTLLEYLFMKYLILTLNVKTKLDVVSGYFILKLLLRGFAIFIS